MDINELIKCLQRVANKHPNAVVYFGHKDGTGVDDEVFLIGEYTDDELTNQRCCCIGERYGYNEIIDDDFLEVVDFDEIAND